MLGLTGLGICFFQLDGAQKSLSEIQPRIEALLAEKGMLEGLIVQLRALTSNSLNTFPPPLSMMPPPPLTKAPLPAPPNSFSTDEVETPEYLWQQIAAAMRFYQRPWTLAEAGAAVEHSFNLSLEPNRPQKVRSSVVRHPEVFERTLDGRYTVKTV